MSQQNEEAERRNEDKKQMLTVRDIQKRLNIGRKQAYELVKQEDFPSIRVGERSIRIPRFAYQSWLRSKLDDGRSGECKFQLDSENIYPSAVQEKKSEQ